MTEISFKKINTQLLNENTNLNQFNCKINDLAEFLKEDALKQNSYMMNTTYVVSYKNKVIAFYTVSVDTIPRKNLPKKYKKMFKDKNIFYNSYPALKLGRLGVDRNYDNKGLGSFLLKKVITLGIKLSKEVGLRFVSIDAYIGAYKFYEKNYCEHIFNEDKIKNKLKEYETLKSKNNKRADNMTLPMFYDLDRFDKLKSK